VWGRCWTTLQLSAGACPAVWGCAGKVPGRPPVSAGTSCCVGLCCSQPTSVRALTHPDAPPTDLAQAARQLKLATSQDDSEAADHPEPSKKQQLKAAAAGLRTPASSGGHPGQASEGGCGPGQQQQGQQATSSDAAAAAPTAWQLRLQRCLGIRCWQMVLGQRSHPEVVTHSNVLARGGGGGGGGL